MKTNVSVKKALITTILVIATGLTVILMIKNHKLKSTLNEQKLKSEIILSEKLNLDKALAKMNREMTELKSKNISLDKKITDANARLYQKSCEIEQLMAEQESLKGIEKKNAELLALIQQLNSEINDLNLDLAQFQQENIRLSNLLVAASSTNSNLLTDNLLLKAIISDNYRTEALRGNKEKLTINARRTDKLMISFDIPGNVNNSLYFKVITPEGIEYYSNHDLAANIKIIENGDALIASAGEKMGSMAGTKRVEMTFKPNKKLKDGIYVFQIFNDERFLGSTQLRLK